MRLDGDQIKWLDKQCQRATKQYREADGFSALVAASDLLSLSNLARLFYFQVDTQTGKIYSEDKEKKTRTYVS